MTTATAVKPVIFASKFPNYRLVRIQEDVLRSEGGRKIGEIAPGSRSNARYDVEDDGAPWAVVFEGGAYEAKHPIIIEWLRNHDKCGSPDGFYEQDPEAVEVTPTLVDQMARIARASALDDASDLIALLDEEKDTHSREPVVQAAEDSLRVLGEKAAQADADASKSDSGDSSSHSSAPD